MWCPWPMALGVDSFRGGVGDGGGGAGAAGHRGGPAPARRRFGDGPAELILIAERPGTGGSRRGSGGRRVCHGIQIRGPAWCRRAAGSGGPRQGTRCRTSDSTVVCAGRGVVAARTSGEPRGLWLYAIMWPAAAGYLLAEQVCFFSISWRQPAQ